MAADGPSETGTPLVSIVIVNFNSGSDLGACLSALAAQSAHNIEIIVVDNASADDSLEQAADALAETGATLVRLEKNTGFAAGVNRGAAAARGRWLATLNPDARPEPGWLAALSEATECHRGATMFGSTQLRAEDPARLDGCGDCYHVLGLAWRGGFGWPHATAAGDAEVFSPCAAAALYDLAAFRAAGGMDERFFCYLEDVDLGFRLRLMGGRAVQIAGAIVHHEGGGAGGRPQGFEAYHAMRNSLWCFVHNMPALLFWPLFPASLLLHGLLALRGGGAARRGWRDAVTGLPEAFATRRRTQARRRISTREIARWLVWRPNAVRRRAPKRRPVAMP